VTENVIAEGGYSVYGVPLFQTVVQQTAIDTFLLSVEKKRWTALALDSYIRSIVHGRVY